MGIGSFFKSIGSFFAKLFSSVNREKAKEVLTQIIVMADEGLLVAGLVAKLTPTTTDDLIVESLRALNLSASQIINAVDKRFQHAAKLDLATEVLRRRLVQIIQQRGHVQIGDQVISTVGDLLALDPVVFKSAAQAGYALFKLAAKK